MKILALNGSPRDTGTVASLMRTATESLPPENPVDWIDVYGLQMQPCTACMACRTKGACVLPNDDAHRVGQMIQESDGFIIGTPVHWGNMSAQLKLLFDRNVPVFMGESASGMPVPRQKGKPAVIVTACTTPWPFNFLAAESRGAIRAVREILHYAGIRTVATLVKAGTKTNPAIGSGLRAKARRAGAKVVRAASSRS